MRSIRAIGLLGLMGLGLIPNTAWAHYGMVIPSDQMVMKNEKGNIKIDLLFWHPMAMIPMNLDKPAKFDVVANGETKSLLDKLISTKTDGNQTWTTNFAIKRPGLYVFCMEPQPYWEPAEDKFIIHHTKVVVTALGDDTGWDKPVGLKTEIVPLSKPYAQYAGNVFQGIVFFNGKPVPGAEVEVEYYNQKRIFKAPNDYLITQTVKADSNGVFTYAAPKAGWWGFAALNEADFKLTHDGVNKSVELGAVLWVEFHDMK